MCITVKKKFKNVEKWKFKLASKFLKKVENPEKSQNPMRTIYKQKTNFIVWIWKHFL